MSTMTPLPPPTTALTSLLNAVAHNAREAHVFAAVTVTVNAVICDAKASASPAHYRLTAEQGRLYVEVTTADRWLSHSIEADLLNTGDKLEELIDEELVELGASPLKTKVEHFRNDAKLFVFRSLLPVSSAAAGDAASIALATRALIAYEACFATLGDMSNAVGE